MASVSPVSSVDPGTVSVANTYSFSDLDAIALLAFVTLVFMQQAGFAALEAGSVRAKNTRNILLKNIIDKLVCGVCYFAVGFGFAYGKSFKGIIGYSHFGLSGYNLNVGLLWFFSFNFLLTSCTIVSGAIAERAKIEAYLAYAVVMSVIIYPIVLHWTQGWLGTFTCRYLDFAGGSTVHLIGGVAAFMGAWNIGPRKARGQKEGLWNPIVGHNVELVATGALTLWFGWYGFNIAPAFLQGTDRVGIAARSAVDTTVSVCGAALTTLLGEYALSRRMDLQRACNGILAGAVAITGLAGHVDPWAALVIGILGGLVYMAGIRFMDWLRIDDPLEAVTVHGFCSLVGLIGSGFFVQLSYLEQYRPGQPNLCGGLFFGSNFRLLGTQLLGVLVIGGFSGAVSFALFRTLHAFGGLRVDQNHELQGLDLIEGNVLAYPDFVLVNTALDEGQGGGLDGMFLQNGMGVGVLHRNVHHENGAHDGSGMQHHHHHAGQGLEQDVPV